MSQTAAHPEIPNFDNWKDYPINLDNQALKVDVDELKERLISDANRLFVSDSDSKPQLLSLDPTTPGKIPYGSFLASLSERIAKTGAHVVKQEFFTSAERLEIELARISPRKDLKVL